MPSARVAKLLADRLLLLVSHRLFIPIQHVSPAMYTSTSRGIRANCDDTPVSPYSAANGGSLVSNGRTKTNQTDIDFSTFPSPAYRLYNSLERLYSLHNILYILFYEERRLSFDAEECPNRWALSATIKKKRGKIQIETLLLCDWRHQRPLDLGQW